MSLRGLDSSELDLAPASLDSDLKRARVCFCIIFVPWAFAGVFVKTIMVLYQSSGRSLCSYVLTVYVTVMFI